MSRVMMRRKSKSRPSQPLLKAKWRANIDDHPIGLAWSPDGKNLAVAGVSGPITLFNGADGAVRRKLRLWNSSGDLIREYPDANSTITDIKWRHDGKHFAISAYNGVVLYDPTEAEPLRRFEWQGSTLTLEWSPDGNYVATGDQDSTVHFWIADTGQDLQMWGYETKVLELAWSFNSRYLATGGGTQVVIWDCSGKGPENTRPIMLEGHQHLIKHLAFQRCGMLLASGGNDGLLAIWKINKKKPALLADAVFKAPIAGLAWSPDDRIIAVSDESGTLSIAAVRRK